MPTAHVDISYLTDVLGIVIKQSNKSKIQTDRPINYEIFWETQNISWQVKIE